MNTNTNTNETKGTGMSIRQYLDENEIIYMPINIRKVKEKNGKVKKMLIQDPVTHARPKVQELYDEDLVERRLNHLDNNPQSYNTFAIDTQDVHQIDMDIDFNKLDKVDQDYIRYVHEHLPYYKSMGKGYKHIFFAEERLLDKLPKFRESIRLSRQYLDEEGKKEDVEILKGQWSWCDLNTLVYNHDVELQLEEHDGCIDEGQMKSVLSGLTTGLAKKVVKKSKRRPKASKVNLNSKKNEDQSNQSDEPIKVKEVKLDLDYTFEYIEEVAQLIDVKYLTDFDSWRAIGWAILSLNKAIGTDKMDLLDLYEEISSKASNYENGACRKIFKSYKSGFYTVGSLLYYARESNSVEYGKLKTKYFGNEGIDLSDEYNFFNFIQEFSGKTVDKDFRMEDMIRKLSRCVGYVAGKGIYFLKNADTFERIGQKDFSSQLRLVSVLDKDGKRKNCWKIFESKTEIFTYMRVVFDPRSSYVAKPKELNLWTGLNSKYVENYDENNFSLILDHLNKIICGGDENCYRYLLGWLATIVQTRRKTGKCIVLISKQGAGKGVFVNNLAEKLIGAELCNEVNNIRDITGKFNAHQEGKILTVLDEALNYTSTGDYHSTFNMMKNKITEPYQLIEQKGVNKYKVRDFTNYIICSNNPNPIKLEGSDRRYVVFNVSNDRIGDHDYFDNLVDQVENQDNVNQFYSYLMDYDLSEFELNVIPQTKIKRDIAVNCMPSEKKFLYHISVEDKDLWEEYHSKRYTKTELYVRYQNYCTDLGTKALGKITFYKRLRELGKCYSESRTSKAKLAVLNLEEAVKLF